MRADVVMAAGWLCSSPLRLLAMDCDRDHRMRSALHRGWSPSRLAISSSRLAMSPSRQPPPAADDRVEYGYRLGPLIGTSPAGLSWAPAPPALAPFIAIRVSSRLESACRRE